MATSKKEALIIIAKRLKGVPWAIFSGTAIEIYTNEKRIGNDIDIIIPGHEIDHVAQIFNTKAFLRTITKDNLKLINDYVVQVEVAGIPVEFVGKTEEMRIGEDVYYLTRKDSTSLLFNSVEKRTYLGVEVYVTSVEENIVEKMIFDRTGQWQDQNDVKLLLSTQPVNRQKFIKAMKRWGVPTEKQKLFLGTIEKAKANTETEVL